MSDKTYTREEVIEIINAGANLVQGDPIGEGERDNDLINIVANAQLGILENPSVTMDEMLDENFSGGSAEVRSWWSEWA